MFNLTTDQRINRDFLELFQEYVELKGRIHLDRFKLYLACEGLKQLQNPLVINRITGVICRFVENNKVLDSFVPLGTNIVLRIQQEVKLMIFHTTYLEFLASKICADFLESLKVNSTIALSSDLVCVSNYYSSSRLKPEFLVLFSNSHKILFRAYLSGYIETSVISYIRVAFVETARDHREWEIKYPQLFCSSRTLQRLIIGYSFRTFVRFS